MTIIKRLELPSFLAKSEQAAACRLYLFFGERFLCRDACDQVEKALAGVAATVHRFDGDAEDPARTLAGLMTFSLLPGRQIYRVTDSRLLQTGADAETLWQKLADAAQTGNDNAARRHALTLARLAGIGGGDDASFTALSDAKWREAFAFAKPPGDLSWADRLLASAGDGKKDGNAANLADMYIAALEKGFAAGHYLLLTCDSVDKRQRLFSFIKKNAVALAVDCSVTAGATSAAKNEQEAVLRDVVAGRLALLGKKIEPGALQLLFARAGFHPTAVAVEVEKLALYGGEREKISRADVELLTGRTREDALFELTDALALGDKGRLLTTLAHLSHDGVHALAILATMRNFLRKLLIFKALQERNDPPWTDGMNSQRFQNDYLPALKEKGQFADQLQGHPYVLFKNFSTAARYAISALREHLESVLEAEYQLKGSELPTGIVLEEMLVRMMERRGE